MMGEKINDGGPAFPGHPTSVMIDKDGVPAPFGFRGMSMRDWFAGMALQGILYMVSHGKHDTMPHGPRGLSEEAYRVADAMLKARGE